MRKVRLQAEAYLERVAVQSAPTLLVGNQSAVRQTLPDWSPVKTMTVKQKKSVIRKAKRLAAEEARRRQAKDPTTREVILRATRLPDAISFQARRGYFSPRSGPVYVLSDLDLAEAMERPAHMVEACAKLGFTVLSQLLNYTKPAPGTRALTDLIEAAGKWLKLDFEALRKELEAERAETQDPMEAPAEPPAVASADTHTGAPVDDAATGEAHV